MLNLLIECWTFNYVSEISMIGLDFRHKNWSGKNNKTDKTFSFKTRSFMWTFCWKKDRQKSYEFGDWNGSEREGKNKMIIIP